MKNAWHLHKPKNLFLFRNFLFIITITDNILFVIGKSTKYFHNKKLKNEVKNYHTNYNIYIQMKITVFLIIALLILNVDAYTPNRINNFNKAGKAFVQKSNHLKNALSNTRNSLKKAFTPHKNSHMKNNKIINGLSKVPLVGSRIKVLKHAYVGVENGIRRLAKKKR